MVQWSILIITFWLCNESKYFVCITCYLDLNKSLTSLEYNKVKLY